MSYFDLALGDGTVVQVRKLRTIRRSSKRRDDSHAFSGRKAVYGTHIPVIRRRRERKAILSWQDGIRRQEPSPLPRTYVPHDPKMEQYKPLFLNMGWTVK